MSDEDVEKVWTEYWVPTITAALEERGQIFTYLGVSDEGFTAAKEDVWDQVKRELFDFHSAMQVVPSVYEHATGGALSKITYNSVSQITGMIDEHYADVAKDQLLDALLDVNEMDDLDGDTVEVVGQTLLEAFGASVDELVDAGKRREAIRAMVEKARALREADGS